MEYKKDPLDEKKTLKFQVKFRLFMLAFDNSESIDKIYGIKNIAYQVVQIKALRKNTTRMVQCKNCQRFNHARSSCYKRTRCVKCADEYLTESCRKFVNDKPMCTNCGEAHS